MNYWYILQSDRAMFDFMNELIESK